MPCHIVAPTKRLHILVFPRYRISTLPPRHFSPGLDSAVNLLVDASGCCASREGNGEARAFSSFYFQRTAMFSPDLCRAIFPMLLRAYGLPPRPISVNSRLAVAIVSCRRWRGETGF